jgi:DNA processing protein
MCAAPSQPPQINAAERLDRLRLIRSENVGPVTFRQLMRRFANAGAALDALPDLARRGGSKRPIRLCSPGKAERELAALSDAGGRLIALGEADYPAPLAVLGDAPPVLSVLGDPRLLTQRIIAMVGARNGSANGMRFAEKLARDLGAVGLVIASGLARGLDTAAHRGSLKTGTIAVVAGGVDVIYPRENEGLYHDIIARGAVISEQPWGMQPTARHFPHRNRIVSGLALGTVVVEATLRSGSLITARLAGEQGREVLAVPGNPLDPRSQGTNGLIRDGATLIQNADDLLEALAAQLRAPIAAPRPLGTPDRDPGPDPDQGTVRDADQTAAQQDPVAGLPDAAHKKILSLLGAAPVGMDEILRQSGFQAHELALALTELELAGRLIRHPGGQVSLAFD